MNCYTNKIDTSLQAKLKEFFIQDGATLSAQQYAFWRAKSAGYSATFYNSGKFMIQGSNVDDIVAKVENFLGISTVQVQNDSSDFFSTVPKSHIGVDESGKGDFFGPLIISAVLVDESNHDVLVQAGVKDCKKVDDKNIGKLAAVIKNNCVFSVITVNPAKYNELYSKFNNLNKLLAWGHARAIENVLEKKPCDYALSDKFADESLIKNALLKLGKSIHLEQRCKGETDIAVAAASIVARAHFLSGMSELSAKYGVEIPKGASDKVVEVAKQIRDKYSKAELVNVAKTHFKTYSQV